MRREQLNPAVYWFIRPVLLSLTKTRKSGKRSLKITTASNQSDCRSTRRLLVLQILRERGRIAKAPMGFLYARLLEKFRDLENSLPCDPVYWMLDFAAWFGPTRFGLVGKGRYLHTASGALSALRRLGIVIAIAILFVLGLATTVYLSLRSPK